MFIADGMKRHFVMLSILFTVLTVPLWTTLTPAQSELPTGGLFAEQCDTAISALLLVDSDAIWLNLKILMSMEFSPGIWYGYDSSTPFGGSYPLGEREAYLYLYTPCGEMFTIVWRNLDGSLLVFAMTNDELTDINGNLCRRDDGSERCGNHQFEYGYVEAEEWQRVTEDQQNITHGHGKSR